MADSWDQFKDAPDASAPQQSAADPWAQFQDKRTTPLISPSMQVGSPAANWSNIGTNSMAEAGIRPLTTPMQSLQGALQAAMPFNLGDEMAASAASTKDRFTTQEQPAYDAALTKAREAQGRFQEEHPIANFALGIPGNVVATMALPGGPVTQGAISGALQGFGAGEGTADRLVKGGVGGAVGLGTSLLLSGAGRYINNKATPPEARGAQYVQSMIDKSGKSLDTLEAAQSDKPITAAEAISPQAETNLMALARREGQTGTDLSAQMLGRRSERTDRIMGDMAAASGIHPEAAKGNIQDLVNVGREVAGPLYKAAFDRPGYAVWSPRIQQFLDDPVTRSGLSRGLEIQRLELLAKGEPFKPSDYGVSIDDTGQPIISWNGQGGAPVPNLRTLDAAKRGIDAMLEGYRNPVTRQLVLDEKGRALEGVRKAFVSAVDQIAPPEYKAARAMSGSYLSANSAFNSGQKAILDRNTTEADFAKMIDRMGEGDKEALKGGIANKLFDLSQNGTLRPAQFMTPRVQAKLSIALGENEAKEFVGNLEKEAAMRNFETRAMPAAGSQTMSLTQAAKEQDAFGSSKIADDIQNALLSGHGPKGIATNVAGGWLARQGQALADQLKTSGLNTTARNEAGRLLLMSPEQLAMALRNTNFGPVGPAATVGKVLHHSAAPAGLLGSLLLTQ